MSVTESTNERVQENLEDLYELSPMQQGMLFHSIYSPDSGAYFEQSLFTIRGDLNVSAFEHSWQRVVERHSILRTSFLWEDLASPVQVVHRRVELAVSKHDWRGLSVDERERKLQSFIATDRGRDFLLSSAPLVRLALFRVADNEHKFLLSRHHLLLDRWSRALLVKDFFVIYDALSDGRQPILEPSRPYGEYIAWLAQQDTSAAESFWRKSLSGFLEPTSFVVDRKTDQTIGTEKEYSDRRIQLSESVTEKLQTFARQHRLTMNTLAQGAWALLLSRYSGTDDVLFGVTMAGRPAGLSGVESMVGLFINTLPLRVELTPTASVLTWLRDLQERQAALQQYEYSSLLDIHGWSDVPRSEPLFESIFVFENLPVGSSFQTGSGALEMVSDRGIGSITDYPLTVLVVPGSKLHVQMVFDRSRFAEATVDRMLGHLTTILVSLVANPDQRLDELSLLTQSERRQILDEWNQTQVDYEKDRCIHELFEAQVEKTPEAIALVGEDERLTYLDLNQRANQLAHYLMGSGVGPESLVGVFMERSVEMIVGLLAIVKAGGAYVPLDPTYPQERIRFTVDDAGLSIVLTQERLAARLPASDARMVCVDRDWQKIRREPAANPVNKATSGNLAYLIYTSGSTGKPKGVAIEHRSVVAFLEWALGNFSREELDGVLASTSICFDLSVFEMFVPLSCGGKVILAEDALQLPTLKAKAEVKLINTVPSAMTELVRLGGLPNNLATVNLAGEPLRTSLVNQIYQQRGVRRVFDLYGPSEDTTYSTFALRSPDQPETIGKPISNTRTYVLDGHLQPVPIGVAGELYLGGAGLVRGYFDRPELTAARFIADPFSVEPGQRLYRTGDLVRYASDGSIEYLGRVDHQVKIRGYRIELDEIEMVINGHPGVRETVLLAREDEAGDRRLVAYVVPGLKAGTESAVNEDYQSEHVAQWQSVWDETYREEVSSTDQAFNIIGWNSSYTGEPIPADEMKEWVDRTVERILSLGPGRVLEIGCGTGLLLFRIAPHSQSYHGIDLSQKALDYLGQQLASSSVSYQNVTIARQEAGNLVGVESSLYDTVILNSVVQYFPSVDYLVCVLEEAARAVKPGGAIFLGDLRSLRLLDVFHTSIELFEARSSSATAESVQRARKEVSQEKELAIDSGLFAALKSHLPTISRVEIQLKRGRARNELTKFRYDVILHMGNAAAPRVDGTWLQWRKDVADLNALRRLVENTRPEILGISGLLNDRLVQDVRALQLAAAEDAPATVEDLRRSLKQAEVVGSVDPEDVWMLGAELGYETELKWGVGSRDSCDLVLRRCDSPVVELASDRRREELKSHEKVWSRYANNPLQGEIARKLVPDLRRVLTEKLPEHMMPFAFVLLDALPLTANGKLDRRALPPPGQSRPELETNYLAPRTPAEEMLAAIWVEVLKLKQMGVDDDFFQLGGHSLLATQVISRVRERFRIELPLRYLFDFPTVAGLATAITSFAEGSSNNQPKAITKGSDRAAADLLANIYQLTDQQVEALLSEALADKS
ncbi:MAG: amino acid adenylation domain-containing protein [Acidobacteriota bacterium]